MSRFSDFVNEKRQKAQAAHDALNAHRAKTDAMLARDASSQPTAEEWRAHARTREDLEFDVLWASQALLAAMRIDEDVAARMARAQAEWEASQRREVSP
jgi:hypothetical protein